MLKQLIRGIFFGNYFYGLCAVALSVESAVQLGIPLNTPGYYLLVYCACTWFYTRAYVQDQQADSLNQRTQWYRHQSAFIRKSQRLLLLLSILTGVLLICKIHYWPDWQGWLTLAVFPLTALLYYGPDSAGRFSLKLRNRGWLKPFLIAFIWAGTVSVYPLFYYRMCHEANAISSALLLLLFLKNLVFISILCIMFDIKDYAADYNQALKTFVVKHGLRKTIYRLLIPLSMAGLLSLLIIGNYRQFSAARIACNTLPFAGALFTAYSLQRRHSILFYLVWIDGLMLLKAVLGIWGVRF